MKKILVTLVIEIALHICVVANTQAQTRIHYRKLGLMKGSADTGLRVYLGDDNATVLNILGQPSRTDSHYSEIDNKTINDWYYNGNKLAFVDDKLIRYDLHDPTLVVGENYVNSFKIGDRMGTTTGSKTSQRPMPGDDPFPIDYFYGYNITKKPGRGYNINYTIVSSNYLKNDAGNLDGGFVVLFDSNKQIINIRLEEY